MRLDKLISGGQTGADRGGLLAAAAAGIPTGGWMPRGYLAQDGSHPEFAARFGIREHPSDRYPPRTARNVQESDATVRFAQQWDEPGTRLTLELCDRFGKPRLDVTPGGDTMPADVVAWLLATDVRVLNVAGNTERTAPGLEAFVVAFLAAVFRPSRPIRRARLLATELLALTACLPPTGERARGAALLAWLVARLVDGAGEPVVLSYGAAWDLLRPTLSRRNRSSGVYRPMLHAASQLDPLDVPILGPVTLDTFIVNAEHGEPGDGLWDDVRYSRTNWRQVLGSAVVIKPTDLR